MSTPWRHTGGVAIQRHSFLTSVGEEVEWSNSPCGHFTPRNNTDIRWTGGRVDPRNGLDTADKRNHAGIRNVNFSARNPFTIKTTFSCFSQDYVQSLMRLYVKNNRKGTKKVDTEYFQLLQQHSSGRSWDHITVGRSGNLMLRFLVMSLLPILFYINP